MNLDLSLEAKPLCLLFLRGENSIIGILSVAQLMQLEGYLVQFCSRARGIALVNPSLLRRWTSLVEHSCLCLYYKEEKAIKRKTNK